MSLMMSSTFNGVDAMCFKICVKTYKPCFDSCTEYLQCHGCSKALTNCFDNCDKQHNTGKRSRLFKYFDEDVKN